ncbi:hypothetical protein TNCV_4790731 [Trichonephila clavipes]|nr:hypothetical protein TNCV_4790731 [Trichonephila clavipes]
MGYFKQPSSHKSSRAVGGREVEAPDQPLGVLSQNWGGTELNRSVTCKVFKTTANDRRRLMSSNNPKLYEEFNIVEIT